MQPAPNRKAQKAIDANTPVSAARRLGGKPVGGMEQGGNHCSATRSSLSSNGKFVNEISECTSPRLHRHPKRRADFEIRSIYFFTAEILIS